MAASLPGPHYLTPLNLLLMVYLAAMALDLAQARADTPGCAHRVHLNHAGASLMPQPVLDAVVGHLRREAEIGGYEAKDEAAERIDAVRADVAELIGARPHEIALLENATRAWESVFYSLPLKAGDRILTSVAEYGSNALAYLHVARRTGAEVVVVPDDEHGQLDVAVLRDAIDDRTRLIGVSHIPTDGGLVNPARAIGEVARDAGVPFLLDACQSVGQLPLDVEELGCDFLSATGRKFLRAPRGTGFLYVREGALELLDPWVIEIRSARWTSAHEFELVDGAQRFETWECSYANQLGLGAATRYAMTSAST
jgi:selenocysteine lyase/cysteine desulfurase